MPNPTQTPLTLPLELSEAETSQLLMLFEVRDLAIKFASFTLGENVGAEGYKLQARITEHKSKFIHDGPNT